MGELKQQSIAMNTELKEQNELLGHIDTVVDDTDFKLQKQTKTINKILD